ncbi:MAG: hypothetical protein IPK67_10325 [Planctomycetes bacterium]|nr:hypothetical protein [Planctomycetota bacterium]
MDLWCACWFWPTDRDRSTPLPSTFASPPEPTLDVANHVAAHKRFFHWELEFPDVFRDARSGFDGVLGNPPWETLQPNSKEFFSDIDPLYRSYGKQEALGKQKEYFGDTTPSADPTTTLGRATGSKWLDYTAGFACDSNWMKLAARPFGDPDRAQDNVERFSIERGKENELLHKRWREIRSKSRGFTDAEHPFQHRGEGKAYTYKLFLEQAHALLRIGERLGFIVPSGLYSDHGTGDLRALFLDRCRWEWLFGFENRDAIFEIHRSFKFNPIVIEKGGTTEAIQTAFMRRKLEDWERAGVARDAVHTRAGRSVQPALEGDPRDPVEARSRDPREDLRELRTPRRRGPQRLGHQVRAGRLQHDERLEALPPAHEVGRAGLPPRRVQPLAQRRLAPDRRAVGRTGRATAPHRRAPLRPTSLRHPPNPPRRHPRWHHPLAQRRRVAAGDRRRRHGAFYTKERSPPMILRPRVGSWQGPRCEVGEDSAETKEYRTPNSSSLRVRDSGNQRTAVDTT